MFKKPFEIVEHNLKCCINIRGHNVFAGISNVAAGNPSVYHNDIIAGMRRLVSLIHGESGNEPKHFKFPGMTTEMTIFFRVSKWLDSKGVRMFAELDIKLAGLYQFVNWTRNCRVNDFHINEAVERQASAARAVVSFTSCLTQLLLSCGDSKNMRLRETTIKVTATYTMAITTPTNDLYLTNPYSNAAAPIRPKKACIKELNRIPSPRK